MKSLKNLLLLSLMSACALLTAKADSLSISLAQPFQTGSSGDVLTFVATVTNVSSQTVYLNGDNTFVDSPLILDDSPYFAYPLTLGPGDSYTGALFNVDIPGATPSGLYTGYFDISGGHYNSSEQYTVGEADFNVQVTPEPSSVLLLATGLAGLALLYRRGLKTERVNPSFL